MKRLFIHVLGRPPKKDLALSQRVSAASEVEKLIRTAKEEIKDKKVFNASGIRVTFSRVHCQADGDNILLGILDVLSLRWNKHYRNEEWGLYQDDRQIKNISYTEIEGEREEYWVEIFYEEKQLERVK